jgi:adenosylcobalamin-dependent ribonucleoside-triphosphate reductase
MHTKFQLSDTFVKTYKNKKPPFGFNGLGEIVYIRTYSRIKEDGNNEEWYETCERVVNGTYTMQKHWIDEHGLGWNAWKAQKSAQEMYDRMFNMKFLPPGRGLWAMGSPITEEKHLYAALNNCSFISTETIDQDFSMPFCFLMDMSMLGVGVGFDCRGAEKIIIKGVNKDRKSEKYIIADTREGWVDSVKILLEAYSYNLADIEFDYSQIRKEGESIKGFGGISSGSKPLEKLHTNIRKTLNKATGEPISIRYLVDIMNMIGECVVSGNVRRTAEIVFGDPSSEEYLDLKNYNVNPDREEYGWTSNNSVFAEIGMDYSKIIERTKNNGEPGYLWLENAKQYSRMNNGADNKDFRITGCNPCAEQSLESGECCCLVEVFPTNCIDKDDFLRTLKFAYLYAKTVTLGKTHWPVTNRVMLRNRRIGCSLTGITQFIAKKGIHLLKEYCESGYKYLDDLDTEYSEWLAIPKSIKKTSVKPSGSISLLAGVTPGMHFPESLYYIRRVRISKNSKIIEPLTKAGYKIEVCKDEKENTLVVEIPVKFEEKNLKTTDDITIWEQLSLAAFLQKYWSDNQVSCTVTFKKDEEDQLLSALNYFQYQLKSISFLPKKDKKVYEQAPYEKITEEEFNKLDKNIKKVNFKHIKNEQAETEKFCDGDSCMLGTKK